MPVRGRPRMKSGRSMRSAVDLAVLLAQLDLAQSVLEQAHEIAARDHAAEQRELRFAFERREQPRERRAEGVVAEVAEPRVPARGLEQRVRVEARERDADPSQRSAGAVEHPQPQR